MGRYFQTAPTQFIDDFIYQPPWELIQQNNMLKAQNYDTQQKTLNLIGNLPIDFWDKPDSELAKAKQDEYRNVTNSLTETFKKDPNNKEAMLQLHDISNKIYQDYTYGDLAKLRKNKENHDKFLAIADTIKDPQEREIFLKQEGLYLQPNEQGLVNNALKKQFEFMEAQPLRNLPTEFLSSDAFKSLEASMNAGEDIKIGNEFITKTGYSNEELKSGIIQQAYKHWLEGENLDKGNWSRYMTELAGIKDLSDDKGQLRWDNNSYLGKSIKTVGDTYKYKKSKSTKDVDVNQVSEAEKDFQRKLKLQKAEQIASQVSNIEATPDIPQRVANILSGHQDMEDYINKQFGQQARKLGKTPREYMSFVQQNLEKYRKIAPQEVKKITDIYNKSKELSYASKQELFTRFPGYADKIESAITKNIKTSKSTYLIPTNNSTHNGIRSSITDLNSGNQFINGERIKKGSVQIMTDQIMTVPATNLEGSVVVYPISYTNSNGEKRNDYIYKNLGELFQGK